MTVLAYLTKIAYEREGVVGITVSGDIHPGDIHLSQGRHKGMAAGRAQSVSQRFGDAAVHILAGQEAERQS